MASSGSSEGVFLRPDLRPSSISAEVETPTSADINISSRSSQRPSSMLLLRNMENICPNQLSLVRFIPSIVCLRFLLGSRLNIPSID